MFSFLSANLMNNDKCLAQGNPTKTAIGVKMLLKDITALTHVAKENIQTCLFKALTLAEEKCILPLVTAIQYCYVTYAWQLHYQSKVQYPLVRILLLQSDTANAVRLSISMLFHSMQMDLERQKRGKTTESAKVSKIIHHMFEILFPWLLMHQHMDQNFSLFVLCLNELHSLVLNWHQLVSVVVSGMHTLMPLVLFSMVKDDRYIFDVISTLLKFTAFDSPHAKFLNHDIQTMLLQMCFNRRAKGMACTDIIPYLHKSFDISGTFMCKIVDSI